MYFDSYVKSECFGCGGCNQICPKDAITMKEDSEGFCYPVIDKTKCIECGLCQKTCPYLNMPRMNGSNKYTFGGFVLDPMTRFDSTSGGAFSAIVDVFCDENYVIFGVEARGLLVFHSYITEKKQLKKFRKSKYSQSIIGMSFRNVKRFLYEGKKVLFSGTPCQIAGLIAYLEATKTDRSNLLTIEVICEGVPSPLYVRKLDDSIKEKYGSHIESIDYRYTGKSLFSSGKWDFEGMRIELKNNEKVIVRDRWFNPFWSVWLQHLMSRPSCYKCPFTTRDRVADITLGDLWGVHIYCPELYGRNGGSSLIVCNTDKGKETFNKAQAYMYGHELNFEDAVKYQSPMRKPIAKNPKREEFLRDLQGDMSYSALNYKWASKPSIKLLFQKYIWGNRQKVCLWNIKRKLSRL